MAANFNGDQMDSKATDAATRSETQGEGKAAGREVGHHVKLEVRELPRGTPTTLRIDWEATLLEFFARAADALGLSLLPSPEAPLDTLHNLTHEGDQVIPDLELSVGEYLRAPHTSHDFGIKLERVLFVNTQARVAPEASMRPREILALFEMDTNFTLYRSGSNEPLPLDTEILIERGMRLEAQRDGKYGRNR